MRKEYILRIEEDLFEEIKKFADTQERSVNTQIIYILKKFLEEQKKEDK